jgi:hypothetical protein
MLEKLLVKYFENYLSCVIGFVPIIQLKSRIKINEYIMTSQNSINLIT